VSRMSASSSQTTMCALEAETSFTANYLRN
jgi:hypothetical protein